MKSSKVIFVKAYLNQNLGDDLFVDILVKRYPQHNFMIIVPNKNYYHFSKYKNVKLIKLNKVTKLINFLSFKLIDKNIFESYYEKKCDLTVTIGGSLFIHKETWYKTFLREKNNFYTKHKNFLLGCNFGPYFDSQFKENYEKIFRAYYDICFRDNYSYNLFKHLDNTRIAPDVVFNYKTVIDQGTDKAVMMSIIDPEKKLSENKISEYKQKIKECINYFHKKNYQINLVSFCNNEGDLEYINKIVAELDEMNNITIYDYTNDLDKIIDVIKHSEYIIATRFHCMILGWIMEKNVYPIVYSNKMKNVIDDVGFTGKFTYLENINDFSPEDVLLNKNVKIDVAFWRDKASEQFIKLDKFLEDHHE